MKTSAYLGIEIGGTKLQLVAADTLGKIIQREPIQVDQAGGAEGILGEIRRVLDSWRDQYQWLAAGVGFGGPVERDSGVVAASFHITGWDGFPLGAWLNEQTGVPVAIENDTNAAAFGEWKLGAGAGVNPLFYTNSGSGVGGGLVVDGAIYHGAPPGEAEFGHLRLDKAGRTVEQAASGWALDLAVREAAHAGSSVLASMVGSEKGGEARHLKAALELSDPAAISILRNAAEDLAYALSHVVHLFHPERIVLGGGVSNIGEPWREAVAAALPSFLMKAFVPGPEVSLTTLGEDAVPIGAVACAMAKHKSLT
jgi:glucokinase